MVRRDAKQIFGTGQARNRTATAVRRTAPFELACQTLAMTWYSTADHHPCDVDGHLARAPWYRSKTQPSTADMIAKFRRVLITAKFRSSRYHQPIPEENPRHPAGLGEHIGRRAKVESE